MSKSIELGELTPYSINKKLILAIDGRWSNYFTSKNKNFKVVINDSRLMLIGPKVSSLDPTTNENQSPKETDY